ncbi:hypothetical protein WA026_014075 [Henosepilachna vigintioctopunctata]|uniref:Uncharacterized protein n=1 Tax=Henosepilachna vigintioctopunctata TaxID=420089 RepID=A0AAW1U7P2_9CUCU
MGYSVYYLKIARSKLRVKRPSVNVEDINNIINTISNNNISKTTQIRHVQSFRKLGATKFDYVAANNVKQIFNAEEEIILKTYEALPQKKFGISTSPDLTTVHVPRKIIRPKEIKQIVITSDERGQIPVQVSSHFLY